MAREEEGKKGRRRRGRRGKKKKEKRNGKTESGKRRNRPILLPDVFSTPVGWRQGQQRQGISALL
jgi:hypothetical protein